jgi:ketosteroid isomerase-like protein
VDVEARLRELEDREEIRDLLANYARHLDAGDHAAYADLFAEQGELVARLGSAKGPAAIRELLDRTIGEGSRARSRPALHLLANPTIEVDGDRATASTIWSYVTADDEGYPLLLQLGHYEDALTRENGRWRFLRRDISRDLGYAPYEQHPRVRRDRLRELEDRAAIWELFMDYRRHLDARDFAAYATLFGDDGEWIGNLGRVRGRAEIEEMLHRTLGTGFAVESGSDFHLVANPEVELDGDRASARSTWCFVERGGDGSPVLSLIGRYEDDLVRDGDRWRFARRTAHCDLPFRPLAE